MTIGDKIKSMLQTHSRIKVVTSDLQSRAGLVCAETHALELLEKLGGFELTQGTHRSGDHKAVTEEN